MDEWWRGAVIYQIYPRSFQDSDGDGIGDLPGITRRLEHVADLGADAIWLSPIFKSPMADMGYDVADYRAVDPLFGTMADFDALVERAHGLGLKVIIDQVLSHTSDQHAWFIESRRSRDGERADWYVWADPKPDGSEPNNWRSTFGGPAWTWSVPRRQYYLHNFLASQPDLNFHNTAVQDAMLDAMRFWLERGVDGFRLDTVNFYFHDAMLRDDPALDRGNLPPPHSPYDMQLHIHSKTQPENIAFLNRMRALTDSYEARVLVGEVGESAGSMTIMADYTRGRDRLHMAYSFEMLGAGFDAAFFRRTLGMFFGHAPDGWPCWSFSNHDVQRHVSRWASPGQEDAVARVAVALLLSLRGTPCLYQGEELGQTETDIAFEELTDPPGITFWPDYKGRDGCRTPMVWDGGAHGGFTTGTPWLPVKKPQAARSVSAQAEAADSVLKTYQALIAFRQGRPEMRTGEIAFEGDGEVLTFTRRLNGQGLRCHFNITGERQDAGVGSVVGPSAGVDGGALGPWGWAFEEI